MIMVATALLIIDMQLGNFQGSDPIYEGERLLARIQNLIAKARSAGVPVFLSATRVVAMTLMSLHV
jgi:nicotinamidase-related amidase